MSEWDSEQVVYVASGAGAVLVFTVDKQTGALTKRAEKTIDTDMVPLIESHGSAYFEVSGNTDSTGTRALNQKIEHPARIAGGGADPDAAAHSQSFRHGGHTSDQA